MALRYLSKITGSEWVNIEGSIGKRADEISDPTRKMLQTVSDILLSENLVILCGLGSSLCVKDDANLPLAPSMADLWTGAKGKANRTNDNNFENIKAQVRYTTPSDGRDNIELLLSRCQLAQQLEPQKPIESFITETEEMIVKKCKFIRDDVELKVHEAFLRKVARRSTRLPRTKIFTTNYDLCFEVAASRSRFTIIDGFSHSYPQEFDGSYFGYDLVRRSYNRENPDYIPNVFHLYKLHGSVDWERTAEGIYKNYETKRPCMIYPQQGKYQSSYDQPFIEMISRFQMATRQQNTGLLVIGFGFNDFHLVQPIMSAIKANVGLKLMIVDPAAEQTCNTNIQETMNLIRAGDSRLSIFAAGFEKFVSLIPDLVSETEDEQHQNRLRNVRGQG